jgi:hypothetical protein
MIHRNYEQSTAPQINMYSDIYRVAHPSDPPDASPERISSRVREQKFMNRKCGETVGFLNLMIQTTRVKYA